MISAVACPTSYPHSKYESASQDTILNGEDNDDKDPPLLLSTTRASTDIDEKKHNNNEVEQMRMLTTSKWAKSRTKPHRVRYTETEREKKTANVTQSHKKGKRSS